MVNRTIPPSESQAAPDGKLTETARPSSSPEFPDVAMSPRNSLKVRGAESYSALRNPWAYIRFLLVAVPGLTLDLWSKQWAFHTLGQGNPPRIVIPHVLEFQTVLNHGALFGIGAGQTTLFLFASACALLLVFWMFAQSGARSWALQIALGGILAGALGNMYDRVTVKLLDHYLPGSGANVYVAQVGTDERGEILKEYPPDMPGAEFRMNPVGDAGGVRISQYPRGKSIRLDQAPQEVGFVRDFLKIPTRWFGDRELWPWIFNVADMLLVGGVAILALHLLRDRKPKERATEAVDASGPPA